MYKIKMKKIFMFIVLGIFLVSFVSAISNLDPIKKDECAELFQFCDDCTYVNLTAISYPNGTKDTSLNEEMTKINQNFNYTFCDTSEIGNYFYIVCGDKFGSYKCEEISFKVTDTGEEANTTQGFILLAQLGVVALLFSMGRIFDKRKWKIKMLFDMMATLMTLVLINSLKIVSSESFKLTVMGEMAFYIGMVITSFMFLYLFINATIELINYFKKKQDKKWGGDMYA